MDRATLFVFSMYRGKHSAGFAQEAAAAGRSFRTKDLLPFLRGLADGERFVVDFKDLRTLNPAFIGESFCKAVRMGYGGRLLNDASYVNLSRRGRTRLMDMMVECEAGEPVG